MRVGARFRIKFAATGAQTLKTTVLNHASLGDQVRDALKDEIISGRLKPNDRIDLNEYAQKWSISPTPLRDALKNMETTGLVTIHPRRGVFVADLNQAGLAETFELRVAFEGMAIRLTTRHVPDAIAREVLEKYKAAGAVGGSKRIARLREVDDAIHDVAFEYCNNKRMRKMMESVRDLIFWSKQTIIRNVPEPYDATLPEHVAICEALVKRDGDAAERAMRVHLENSLARIMEWLKAHPPAILTSSTPGQKLDIAEDR